MAEEEELTVKVLRQRKLVRGRLFCDNEVLEILQQQIINLHNSTVTAAESTDELLNDGRARIRATYTAFPNQTQTEQLSLERFFGQRGFTVHCCKNPSSNVYCHKCYKTKKLCTAHTPDDYYYTIEWSYS